MRVPVPAFQKAIELLGRRSHFRREMEAKLRQRGYEEDEVAETLERLDAQALLDDRQTAREFVRGRLARKALGRVRLLRDLRARGVESDVAGEVLDELYPDDDLDLARRAAGRGSREAVARRLDRLGFSRPSIFRVLEELESEDPAVEDF